MASIEENLRATLLSLKQISDRLKSLVLTSVTKSEATANKQAVLDALAAAKTALQGNDSTATLTAIESAISALNNPTVAQIQDGLAKQGSNANADISTIQALIGYTISEIDGV